MSAKSKDKKNRWRGLTVSFRMSKEESELLNQKVYLCGCTKQDYIIKRLLENEIRVVINRKVLSRLEERLAHIEMCLEDKVCDDTVLEELDFIVDILSKIKDAEFDLDRK